MGAQNMGTFHIVVPDAPRSERTSMRVSLPGPVSQEQMAELNNLARPHRLFVSDTGNGITFINPADDPKAAELMEMTLRSEWGRTVSDVLGVGRRDLKTVKVVPGNIDYEPEFAQANAGLGKATQKLFENTTPEARAALDADPAVREQVGAHAERDAEWAAAGSGPARADIQLARRIYVERGFAGLLEALEKGLPLPVIFTALGLGKADDAPSSGKGP
jgi:hypothetical protein